MSSALPPRGRTASGPGGPGVFWAGRTPVSRRIGWLMAVIALSCLPICAQAARAYVSNEDGESVTVIDTQRAEAIATIPVGYEPYGIVCSPIEDRAYVACSGANIIAILDTVVSVARPP